jgi:ubiquinone/menaquinone biosynthesis C-methylase UbiE
VAARDRPEFKPALRFGWLTSLFDPVAALTTRERAVKARTLERARLRPGDAVLDLGCGTGTLAIQALSIQPGLKVASLDADDAVLDRARAKAAAADAQIAFAQGFSTRLPYPDASFDVVLSTLFFHHVSDEDKVLTGREILRVLRPGGRLVVADPGRPHGPLMRAGALLTIQLLDGLPPPRPAWAVGCPGCSRTPAWSTWP